MSHSVRAYLYRKRHLLVIMLAAFGLGLLTMLGSLVFVQKQLHLQQNLVQQLTADNAELVKKLAAKEVSLSIANSGNQALRKELDSQQQALAEQEKALDFYRQLMDVGSKKKGLELHSYALQKLAEPGQYHYRLTFVQYAKRHTTLKASVKIELHGEVDGKPEVLDFSELVSNADKGFEKIQFKYFQVVEGQLTLPDNFEPLRILVHAQLKMKNAEPWLRDVPWQLERG